MLGHVVIWKCVWFKQIIDNTWSIHVRREMFKSTKTTQAANSVGKPEKRSFRVLGIPTRYMLGDLVLYYLRSVISHICFYFVIGWLQPSPNRKMMQREEQMVSQTTTSWAKPGLLLGVQIDFSCNYNWFFDQEFGLSFDFHEQNQGAVVPCGWRGRCF